MKPTHKRLLFVDDEPGVRATLAAILRRYGFAVTPAATVEEALQAIRTNEFDLLLCDLNLQREGDGYEVIRAMREANPRCANIVLTGFPRVETAVEGIHLGIDDYIVKPTSPDVLVALLADKLAARQPQARILSVSADETLLRMRHMIFEKEGYDVVSAQGVEAGIERAQESNFDILVLGHSIPYDDKLRMVQTFRQTSPGAIISLRRNAGEQLVDGADHHVEPDPEPMLRLVREVAQRRAARAKTSHP